MTTPSTDPTAELPPTGLDPAEGAAVVPPLRRPEFRRLLAISVTVALGFGMVIPVLPLYARSFGVGLAAIGLVQLVFGLTRFSFGLVGGLAVDRFGDRAATMAGLLIVAASSYAAGFSDTFLQFVLARGFGGAGSALFINGLMSRILRVIEPQAMGRATGAFRSSFLVGIGAGPIIGGVAARSFGLAAPFHIYATGLLVATVIAWFVMSAPEVSAADRVRRNPIDALRAARPLLADPRYSVALIAVAIGWWTIAGPAQTVGPVFASQRLGLTADQIGLAVTMLAAGEILVLIFAGRAADRYGRRAVLIPAMAVTAVATLLLGQIEAMPWAYAPLMVAIGAGVAAGGTASGGLLADAIPRGGSGAAVGVNQMAGDIGYLLAPTTVGAVAEASGFRMAYLVGALPAFAGVVAALRLPRKSGPPNPVAREALG